MSEIDTKKEFNKEQIDKFIDRLLKDIYLKKVDKFSPTDLESIILENFIHKHQSKIAKLEGRELNMNIYSAIGIFIEEIICNDIDRNRIKNRLSEVIAREVKDISHRNSLRKQESVQ